MAIKSILKPENSIVAGLATVGLVYGIYQLEVGSVTEVHMTEPYNQSASSGIKKAAYTSLALVGGVSLIAKDVNIWILGMATVIAMQAHYRHANMVSPSTGQIVPPSDSRYAPATAAPSQAGTPSLSAVS